MDNNNKNHRFKAIVQVNLEDFVGTKFYCLRALQSGKAWNE